MSFDVWLAFVAACFAISVLPGPSVLMVTGRALARGRRAALWCVLGDVAGGALLVATALFGVGTVLAASPLMFLIVKWTGVVYIIYLGVRQIADRGRTKPAETAEDNAGRAFAGAASGFLVGALNPKAVVFYVAFLPQFFDPAGGFLIQFVIIVGTSAAVAGAILAGYALLAARARATLRSERAQRRVAVAGGGVLIGGGVLMAAAR